MLLCYAAYVLHIVYASNQSLLISLNRVYRSSASGKSFLIDHATQDGITRRILLPKC